jgi:transposase-like protein
MNDTLTSAKIVNLWLIVECPHCGAPNIVRKGVFHNSVIELCKTRFEECENCGKGYFIEVKEMSPVPAA